MSEQDDLDKLLKKALEEGSDVKYAYLTDFLFSVCENFADNFCPKNVSKDTFLEFTLYVLREKFKEKKQGEVMG